MYPWKRRLAGLAVFVAAMFFMPEGPWWREIPTIVLFIMGTRIYDTGRI
jgi:hypothetical protein